MLKFEVGEIAIYRPHLMDGQHFHGPGRDGDECEILSPIISGHHGPSHHVNFNGNLGPRGRGWIVVVADLRKRPSKENAREWFDEKIKFNQKVLEEA